MTEAIELFPYQTLGAKWLSQRRLALLADDMGLGKSAQCIHAADLIEASRVLVICPAVARENWKREFNKFSKKNRQFQIVATRSEEVNTTASLITSYDLAPLLNINPRLGRFDLLILDECHMIKSTDAKRTVAILSKTGLVRKADRVWAVSGTPAPNHPGELWPILYTFGVTKYQFEDFIKRYCTYYEAPQNRGGLRITGANESRIPELREQLKIVMLRRKKEEVMKDLPPISFGDVVVEPGPVDLDIETSFIQYVFPEDKRKELFERLDRERELVESVHANLRFTKDGMKAFDAIAQTVSTLRRYTGIQKVQGTAELIKGELESGAYEKVVIFAIHRDVIEGLRVKLKDFKPVTLYGGTDPDRRTRNVDKFQNNPKCRVFIGNILAAGTAITLTAAHNVVFIEQDWVPGNNAQAAMRCHRIGQSKPVLVRYVGLANSIDEKIAHVLQVKTRQLVELFDKERGFTNMEQSTTQVSNEQAEGARNE